MGYESMAKPRQERAAVSMLENPSFATYYPAEVEPALLDEIRTRLERQEMTQVSSVMKDDVVQISHGPLAGIRAMFDTSLSSNEIVNIDCHARLLIKARSSRGFVISKSIPKPYKCVYHRCSCCCG